MMAKAYPPKYRNAYLNFFVTNKDFRSGTGLGLSTACYPFVGQHGGQLLDDSEERPGTTFTIKIPA